MKSSLRYFKNAVVIAYDPSIRDFSLDANGDAEPMHYVDQRVALTLNILQGTLSGDSTLGALLKDIKRFGTQTTKADAKRAIMSALQDIINDGEIEVVDINVLFPSGGRMDIFVIYKNLILSNQLQRKTASVTIGGNSIV